LDVRTLYLTIRRRLRLDSLRPQSRAAFFPCAPQYHHTHCSTGGCARRCSARSVAGAYDFLNCAKPTTLPPGSRTYSSVLP
jgi:hypothetical protein